MGQVDSRVWAVDAEGVYRIFFFEQRRGQGELYGLWGSERREKEKEKEKKKKKKKKRNKTFLYNDEIIYDPNNYNVLHDIYSSSNIQHFYCTSSATTH